MSNKVDFKELKTSGIGTFGEGAGGKIADRLFKVTARQSTTASPNTEHLHLARRL